MYRRGSGCRTTCISRNKVDSLSNSQSGERYVCLSQFYCGGYLGNDEATKLNLEKKLSIITPYPTVKTPYDSISSEFFPSYDMANESICTERLQSRNGMCLYCKDMKESCNTTSPVLANETTTLTFLERKLSCQVVVSCSAKATRRSN